MSDPTTDYINTLIDQRVRNYPVESFKDMWMNTILHLINNKTSGGGGGGGTEGVTKVTSANFTSSTDCPIVSLVGSTLAVYWNDVNKFLEHGTDFTELVGGGFTILIPGFNSGSATYTFYVFVQTD